MAFDGRNRYVLLFLITDFIKNGTWDCGVVANRWLYQRRSGTIRRPRMSRVVKRSLAARAFARVHWVEPKLAAAIVMRRAAAQHGS